MVCLGVSREERPGPGQDDGINLQVFQRPLRPVVDRQRRQGEESSDHRSHVRAVSPVQQASLYPGEAERGGQDSAQNLLQVCQVQHAAQFSKVGNR